MPRAKGTTIAQEREIIALVNAGERSQSRVHGHLVDVGLITVDEEGNYSVSERTIGRRIRELDPPDSSGPWSALDDESEAWLVLDVAAYVVDVTDGRLWLTKELASWVARVRNASPDIPPAWAYTLARAYRALDRVPPGKRDARAVDIVLAAEPWQNKERAAWYRDLLLRTGPVLPGRAPEQRLGPQPQSLRAEIAALLDTRTGAPAGSFGSPWPTRPQTPDGSS